MPTRWPSAKRRAAGAERVDDADDLMPGNDARRAAAAARPRRRAGRCGRRRSSVHADADLARAGLGDAAGRRAAAARCSTGAGACEHHGAHDRSQTQMDTDGHRWTPSPPPPRNREASQRQMSVCLVEGWAGDARLGVHLLAIGVHLCRRLPATGMRGSIAAAWRRARVSRRLRRRALSSARQRLRRVVEPGPGTWKVAVALFLRCCDLRAELPHARGRRQHSRPGVLPFSLLREGNLNLDEFTWERSARGALPYYVHQPGEHIYSVIDDRDGAGGDAALRPAGVVAVAPRARLRRRARARHHRGDGADRRGAA